MSSKAAPLMVSRKVSTESMPAKLDPADSNADAQSPAGRSPTKGGNGGRVYLRKPAIPGKWNTREDWFCGAMTQAGFSCRMLAIHANGRCKWHGGLSTGPKTDAGKEQARINGRKGGRPKKKPKS